MIIIGSCSEVVSSLWPSCFAATLNSFAKDQEPDANIWSLVLPGPNTKTSCQKLYFAKWVLKNSRPTPRQYRKEFTVFLWEYLKGWGCETMTWLTLINLNLTLLKKHQSVWSYCLWNKTWCLKRKTQFTWICHRLCVFSFQMKVWSLLFGTKCFVYRSMYFI